MSKKWQSPATQVKYEYVTLRAFQIHKIKKLFEDNLSNQDDYFKQLQWAKKLTIKQDGRDSLMTTLWRLPYHQGVGKYVQTTDSDVESRCKFTHPEFSSLMSYLPSLQEFDLNDCKSRNTYMAILRDLDPTIYLNIGFQ